MPQNLPLAIYSYHQSLPPPPTYTLFPYTTLFRSPDEHRAVVLHRDHQVTFVARLLLRVRARGEKKPGDKGRSEEHTSELQSLAYLVCRLLLEKKKKEMKDGVIDYCWGYD